MSEVYRLISVCGTSASTLGEKETKQLVIITIKDPGPSNRMQFKLMMHGVTLFIYIRVTFVQ